MPNPYQSAESESPRGFVFDEHAECTGASFLYRRFHVHWPVECEVIYSGWWFVQRIHVDGVRVWSKVSWLWLSPRAEFRIPSATRLAETVHRDPASASSSAGTDPLDPASTHRGRIELDFGRGLLIRRCGFWIDDILVYDEVH